MREHPVLKVLLERKSIRRFKPDVPPNEVIETVVRAGQQAPFAAQMGSVLLSRDRERHPFKAPLLFTILVDVRRLERVLATRGWTRRTSDLALLLFGIQDAAYLAENMVIAAEALGLGSCFLGGAPFQAERLREEYGLPERVFPLVQLAMGYPDEDPPPRPRYPLAFTLYEGRYPADDEQALREAMRVMDEGYLAQDYYRRANLMVKLEDGREETHTFATYSWTEHMGRKWGQWLADPQDLLRPLAACGFHLDRGVEKPTAGRDPEGPTPKDVVPDDATERGFAEIERQAAKWARAEDGIRALIVIGSRARADHPADRWADLDLVVIARNPEPYLAGAAWVTEIGEAILTFVEPTGDGKSRERRVLFEGGFDVDFAFFPLGLIEGMLATGIPPDAADVFCRGARVLVDKDGLAERVLAAVAASPLRVPSPPTVEEFLEVVNDFWYHAVWTAKHLRRGELWWAKGGCDGHMKDLLRRMLEWHARATHGPGHDTWMRGRFLEEWADPRAVAELKDAFGHYDPDDLWRALIATMNLFRWVARETAAHLGLAYPAEGDAVASEIVLDLRSCTTPDSKASRGVARGQ